MGRDRADDAQVGKDELNLAEFPIATIGKRPAKGAKTLVFEDEVWDRALRQYVTRKLVVTGSDLLGLPTQIDDEVLLGCIQLSKRSGFHNQKVHFTRYDLIRLLDWPDGGRSYSRIAESLDRWTGTIIISDKAWWDKENQCWVKDTFNIIDRVHLVERETVKMAKARGREIPHTSWLLWGDFMWQSFRAGNLKDLDFQFWKSLRSSAAKRLYRLLDKRFFFGATVTFDLHCLAHEKIGLSRTMRTGQIKQKLTPAHEELRERGFCRAKYVRRARSKWDVIYEKKGAPEIVLEVEKESELEVELISRGVLASTARVLASSGRVRAERIREKIELFDWYARRGEKKGAGFLVKSIEDDYPLPEGFETAADREKRRRSAEMSKRRRDEAVRAADAKKTAEQEAKTKVLRRYLASLSEDELAALEAKALSERPALFVQTYERYKRTKSPRLEALRESMLEELLFPDGATNMITAS